MRRSLSSTFTIIPMFALPAFLAWVLIVSILSALIHGTTLGSLITLAIVGFIFALILNYSWKLRFASIDASRLYFWSYRGSSSVPLGDIKQVKAVSSSRNPRIEVVFGDETQMGNKITIMPPLSISGERYWDVYELLIASAVTVEYNIRDIAARRKSDRRMSSAVIGVCIFILILIVSQILKGE